MQLTVAGRVAFAWPGTVRMVVISLRAVLLFVVCAFAGRVRGLVGFAVLTWDAQNGVSRIERVDLGRWWCGDSRFCSVPSFLSGQPRSQS